MKKNLALSVFILSMFLFSTKLPAAEPGLAQGAGGAEPTISMDFQDANLKDVLKILSMQAGLNFIASEGVQDRKITLYLDNVPLNKAMDQIFRANNLSYELDKAAKIFVVRDWGKLQTETVTKVFYLKYSSVSSSAILHEKATGAAEAGSVGAGSAGGGAGGDEGITKVITKLLSTSGVIVEDARTNVLIITDTPNRMAVISQVIASLDVPVPQVVLEVEMVDVSKNVLDQMGFSYGSTPFTLTLTGATAATGFPFHSWGKLFTDGTKGSFNVNNAANGATAYTVAMDFLRTQTDARFLARPKILTLSNETAEIRIATNEAIGVNQNQSSGGSLTNSTVEAERAQTGVILRITPQVNMETGEVTIYAYPKVAVATQGATFNLPGSTPPTVTYRDPEERSTKSMVRIKDGDTVVIGGLIRDDRSIQETKLPFLGDIPLIGVLFRHKGGTSANPDQNKQRELLVFITPHIVKETKDMKVIQPKKVVLPEREQDFAASSMRNMAVINTLNAFEKKNR
ncbi:MAG: secretin N-terminal domain-containing protein [Candidatus Omnitrophota bacterium]|jgi:type IV pilus assembly protein PilQ